MWGSLASACGVEVRGGVAVCVGGCRSELGRLMECVGQYVGMGIGTGAGMPLKGL